MVASSKSNRKRALGYGGVLDFFLFSRSLSSRISFAFLQPPRYLGPDPALVSRFLPSLACPSSIPPLLQFGLPRPLPIMPQVPNRLGSCVSWSKSLSNSCNCILVHKTFPTCRSPAPPTAVKFPQDEVGDYSSSAIPTRTLVKACRRPFVLPQNARCAYTQRFHFMTS